VLSFTHDGGCLQGEDELMKKPEAQKTDTVDALTTAAQAIGSTLGKIAVKTGLAKPAPAVVKKRAPRKKVAKAAGSAKRKAPVRKAAAKPAARSKKRP
jgi:hypothetical protein